MKIVVIGRSGQLAQALEQRCPPGVMLTMGGHERFNLADPTGLEAALIEAAPDAIINAGAYTKVDAAETDEETAVLLNAFGPAAIARATATLRARFVHLSTDYVFDGSKAGAYVPDDPIAPASAYGRSKAKGEALVMETAPSAVIVRTAWVYAAKGANFLNTMLRLAQTREEVGVVQDQLGCPTFAGDLADACYAAARAENAPGGIYHYAGAGTASWADFSEAIFAEAALRGLPSARVKRITTAEYPTPAKRPANSQLDCSTFAATFAHAPRPWRDALGACMNERAQG